MTSIIGSQSMQTARLDRALRYPVIQGWDELMPDSTSGLVHIDYQTGSDGSLDFLKIWASTVRGHWDLICEFWTKPLWSHVTGLCFSGDYRSAILADTLELLMQRESAFLKLPDHQGQIQVFPPTAEERKEAERWMEVAFDHQGAMPIQRPDAA